MMVDGAEEGQLRGPIGELVPFSSNSRPGGSSRPGRETTGACAEMASCAVAKQWNRPREESA